MDDNERVCTTVGVQVAAWGLSFNFRLRASGGVCF